jgi:hypothetical protein
MWCITALILYCLCLLVVLAMAKAASEEYKPKK